MPILSDKRREKFATLLAQGVKVEKAYEEAGYSPNRRNARRAADNDAIKQRVAEITGLDEAEPVKVADEARRYTQEALDVYRDVMRDPKAPHSARVAAATEILSRGHGKAPQVIEVEPSAYDSLAHEDRKALLAAISAILADRGISLDVDGSVDSAGTGDGSKAD